MPEYQYEGMDNKGKEISGSLVAESKVSAINKIREMGYFPTSIVDKSKEEQEEKKPQAKSFSFFSARVTEQELVVFMRQFATLVNAGLPILRCIRVLEKQNGKKGISLILKDVGVAIEGGSSLSDSLMAYQNVFSPLFVNMVHAGEVGGVLDTVLLQLADYFEKSSKLKKKVKAAMIYPLFVLLIAMTVVFCLMVFIIPKFAAMFLEMDLELPFMTQVLISTSDFIKHYWYVPIIAIFLLVLVFRMLLKKKETRHIIHSVLYRTPIVGDLISKVAISRFSRTLGTLLNSGVQILEALTITKSTIGNSVVEKALDLVHDNLKEGESMVIPLTQSNIFPPMVLSMVAVGEETGQMSEMLLNIASGYEDDVDAAVVGLTSLIEPVLIVTLAAIVGFIVIAMFLPLVSLIQSMT